MLHVSSVVSICSWPPKPSLSSSSSLPLWLVFYIWVLHLCHLLFHTFVSYFVTISVFYFISCSVSRNDQCKQQGLINIFRMWEHWWSLSVHVFVCARARKCVNVWFPCAWVCHSWPTRLMLSSVCKEASGIPSDKKKENVFFWVCVYVRVCVCMCMYPRCM